MIYIAKKRRRKNIIWFYFFTFILFFSIIGVGYGQFNEDLNIDMNITTGYIDPVFLPCEVYEITRIRNFKGRGRKVIEYCVKNRGTIPIKYEGFEIEGNYNGLTIRNRGNIGNKIIKPNKLVKGKLIIRNSVNKDRKYKIKIKLIFKQEMPEDHVEEKIGTTP